MLISCRKPRMHNEYNDDNDGDHKDTLACIAVNRELNYAGAGCHCNTPCQRMSLGADLAPSIDLLPGLWVRAERIPVSNARQRDAAWR